MKLMLDTHILLWFLHDDMRLSRKDYDAICGNSYVEISVASLWEIAIKKAIEKLVIDESVTDIAAMCASKGIEILPIKIPFLETIQTMPRIHNDPFDRLIIATALNEECTLITDDEKIREYDINIFSK